MVEEHFNPGLSNPRFNPGLFNPKIYKYTNSLVNSLLTKSRDEVEKSRVEKSEVEKNGVKTFTVKIQILCAKERGKSWIYITYFRKTNGPFQTTKTTNVYPKVYSQDHIVSFRCTAIQLYNHMTRCGPCRNLSYNHNIAPWSVSCSKIFWQIK